MKNMSNDWSQGYFTDVGYTFGYYREISPVFLRFCLLLQGVMPPESAAPNYCELGVGQGLSLNLHAATTPGNYWGTDFNPEHAAFAQGLARSAALPLDIRDESFEEFLNADLPLMDYITLHGIWTWVSPENQRQIVEFARKFLKPGGALYISYNCYPGWAPAAPLRQIFALHDRFAGRSQGAMARVDAAIQFSERLLGANAAYTRAVPGVMDRLAKIKEQNRNYIAHEYFNREWNVMYFADVADRLAAGKLEFAASAAPLDTVDAIHLSPEAQAMMKEVSHPILREQMRDYFTFAQFRKDIFMRGVRRLTDREKGDLLGKMRFVLMTAPEDIPRKVTGSLLEGNLQLEVYEPLLSQLADRAYEPKRFVDLCLAMEGKATAPQVLQAVTILVGMGHLAPCQDEDAVKLVRARSDKFNAEILRRSVFSRDIAYLAAPVIGGAVSVNRMQQLFLLAKARKHADPVAFAWNVFKENGERLLKEGQVIHGEEESLQELKTSYSAFQEKAIPLLKAMGVVH
jgi:SAM-dependent methyltransferase